MEILEHVARAKSAEYLLALAGLFGFMIFWRVLDGPALALLPVRISAREMLERIAGFLVPQDVFYHPGHAWVRVEGDGLVTVGLDDFASKLIGRVDALHLPPVGSRLRQGNTGWTLAADAKRVGMLAPVDGEVVEVNAAAMSSPRAALADPYGRGWLMKVRSLDLAANLKNLIPTGAVNGWIEGIRESLSQHQAAPALVAVYQDGGLPVEGLAKALDGERWDEIAREYLLTD